MRFYFAMFLAVAATTSFAADLIPGSAEQWPMASGPNGSWTVKTTKKVPAVFSVARNENVLWRTPLPEGGQSGIAVWRDRLFLTFNKPLPDGTPTSEAKGTDIVACCLDATSGKILWQSLLAGTKSMPHSGIFSDNTSPTPVTDGRHVWFVNAGGRMSCFDFDGHEVWTRTFETRTRHNAKNAEPLLYGDWILHVEMQDPDDPKRRPMKAKPGDRNSSPEDWPLTFVRAFDKATGKPAWVADAGVSIHNTPAHGIAHGKPAVFFGRGGGHAPPEKPYGFTLASLDTDSPGKSLWQYDSPSGYAFYVTQFDEQNAYCFEPGRLCVLNLETGNVQKMIPLNEHVDVRTFDEEAMLWRPKRDTTFSPAATGKRNKPYPTNQTNIIVNGKCLFMSYSGHSIGRVDIESRKVEYLEVPVQVVRKPGIPDEFLWGRHIASDSANSRGMDVSPDKRGKGDGWGHVTSASPIAINDLVFFSTMIGTVYVIDSSVEEFDEAALVSVSDLGEAGKTWSLSSPNYANGRLFHRSLKEVVCIGD
ncbi:MAG: PQQ-binding-like beta-propeller repeat protein [Planctomycetota bacterium]|nr:PQQ-binding-like beta-propeller repeat protein [Planctomycetota bacterium]MDA1250799.1 PQQ-binding-like beta-propeller repeat protein [Planctomycetota bacterium]